MRVVDKATWFRESEEVEAIKMGILPVTVEALEGALYLPEGYKIKGVYYDETYRVLKLAIESDELPETHEGERLPELNLHVSVAWLPEDHEYRKITAKIEKGY